MRIKHTLEGRGSTNTAETMNVVKPLPSLSRLAKADLRALAANRGIEFEPDWLRSTLIEAIEEYDANARP